MGFLNIHPDNVQSAESQATQAGAFYQMGFLGWEFHSVFPDKCSIEKLPMSKIPPIFDRGAARDHLNQWLTQQFVDFIKFEEV